MPSKNAGKAGAHGGVTGSSSSATAWSAAAARSSSTGLAAVWTPWLVRRRRTAVKRSSSEPGGWVASGPCPSTTPGSRAGSLLDNRDGLLGALADGLLHVRAQLVGRLVLQDVEEVVVPHLEHLGGDPHADRVALTDIEVDDDLPGHHASSDWHVGRIVVARPRRVRSRTCSRSRRARPSCHRGRGAW